MCTSEQFPWMVTLGAKGQRPHRNPKHRIGIVHIPTNAGANRILHFASLQLTFTPAVPLCSPMGPVVSEPWTSWRPMQPLSTRPGFLSLPPAIAVCRTVFPELRIPPSPAYPLLSCILRTTRSSPYSSCYGMSRCRPWDEDR